MPLNPSVNSFTALIANATSREVYNKHLKLICRIRQYKQHKSLAHRQENPEMINNYVEYEYQPWHLIYTLPFEGKDNHIFLGDVSSALDLEFLERENVKTVVTAAANMDQVSYKTEQSQHLSINHIVYEVLDSKSENLINFFDEFYERTEKALQVGSMLVHCAAGISRSSTLVISYLMKKHTWSFREGVKFVRDRRPVILPNLGFERQLKEYEAVLFKQEHRRLKSKTSESNKHTKEAEKGQKSGHQLNLRDFREIKDRGELLPEIGIVGNSSSTNKKILDAFRIYKKKEEELQGNPAKIKQNALFSHHNIASNSSKNAYKIRMSNPSKVKEFSESKSANLHHTRQGRRDDFSLSKKQLVNVNTNGLFDGAIIPIKYSSSGNKNERLKKTQHIDYINSQQQPGVKNVQTPNTYHHGNSSPNYMKDPGVAHYPNMNRINMLKQKYVNGNGNLSVGQMAVLRMKAPDLQALNSANDKFPSSRGGRINYDDLQTGGSEPSHQASRGGGWDNKRKLAKPKEGTIGGLGLGINRNPSHIAGLANNARGQVESEENSRKALGRNQFVNRHLNNY